MHSTFSIACIIVVLPACISSNLIYFKDLLHILKYTALMPQYCFGFFKILSDFFQILLALKDCLDKKPS